MRNLLVVMAAASLLAACVDRTKARAPAAAAEPSGKAAAGSVAPSKAEKQARKVARAASNGKRSAAAGKDRPAGEESSGAPAISLVQSPPSGY